MDKLDFEIMKLLCKDARMPFKSIGDKIGMRTETVFRRFQKLKEEGIISSSTVVLNSKAFGITGLCGLFIKLKSGASASIVSKILRTVPQLAVAQLTYGEYDFYVDVYFRDFSEIIELVSILRKQKEIEAIDSITYSDQEWSIPFVGGFEGELSEWWLNIRRNGKTTES